MLRCVLPSSTPWWTVASPWTLIHVNGWRMSSSVNLGTRTTVKLSGNSCQTNGQNKPTRINLTQLWPTWNQKYKSSLIGCLRLIKFIFLCPLEYPEKAHIESFSSTLFIGNQCSARRVSKGMRLMTFFPVMLINLGIVQSPTNGTSYL